ncbi:VanW family protein [Bacillus sp. FSL W8-1127]|uniref:VanW family protein n=1 Tax=Bacillus sp. FSL W8-1127 TaxID=2954710 RepID=UPI0030F929D2
MNRTNMFRFFAILLISTIVLMALSKITSLAMASFSKKEPVFAEGTYIGPINISSLNKAEAESKISENVLDWQKKSTVSFTFFNKTISVPMSVVHFKVASSLNACLDGEKNILYTEVDEQSLKTILFKKLENPELVNLIDLEKVKQLLKEKAGRLDSSQQTEDLVQYLKASENKPKIIDSKRIFVNDPADMEDWLSSNSTMTLKPEKIFSLNDYIQNLDNDDKGFFIQCASAIYQLTLPTNLQIVERHISDTLPEGIELGYEARVDGSKADLKIYNPNHTAFVIKSEKISDHVLKLSLIGPSDPFTYQLVKKNVKTYASRKVIQYRPLAETAANQNGKYGYSAELYKQVALNHKVFYESLVSKDFYLPIPKIVVENLKQPESDATADGNSGTENDATEHTANEKIDPASQNTTTGNTPNNEADNSSQTSQNGSSSNQEKPSSSTQNTNQSHGHSTDRNP